MPAVATHAAALCRMLAAAAVWCNICTCTRSWNVMHVDQLQNCQVPLCQGSQSIFFTSKSNTPKKRSALIFLLLNSNLGRHDALLYYTYVVVLLMLILWCIYCSEGHPRVIDESRAKQLESELGSRCRYYETCATYGLNVEHVFTDGELWKLTP